MAFSLLADVEVPSILDLHPDWFRRRGIRLMLLDFDNTIVAYHVDEPSPEFLQWMEDTRQAGVEVMVVSNSRKSHRVPDFCRTWNIPFIRHAGKPRPGGIRRAMAQFSAAPEETALAGDQTFTDVLGANLAGITSVLVKPIHYSNPFQAIRHGLELPFIHLGRLRRKR